MSTPSAHSRSRSFASSKEGTTPKTFRPGYLNYSSTAYKAPQESGVQPSSQEIRDKLNQIQCSPRDGGRAKCLRQDAHEVERLKHFLAGAPWRKQSASLPELFTLSSSIWQTAKSKRVVFKMILRGSTTRIGPAEEFLNS